MKVKLLIISVLSLLTFNSTYAADDWRLNDDVFKIFVSAQKANIDDNNSVEKSCNWILSDTYNKYVSKKTKKTYIYNKIDYSKHSATQDAFDRIENPNSDQIKVLPNLYLWFTSNEKIICNESIYKKISYWAIETLWKKVLTKSVQKALTYVDYAATVYDFINKQKVVDNPFMRALLVTIVSTPERNNYVSAGWNYYEVMYLSTVLNWISTYSYIDKTDSNQVYDLFMRNKMASLQTCYTFSQTKKDMKSCLTDFSNSVVRDLWSVKKTNLKSKDINTLLK